MVVETTHLILLVVAIETVDLGERKEENIGKLMDAQKNVISIFRIVNRRRILEINGCTKNSGI